MPHRWPLGYAGQATECKLFPESQIYTPGTPQLWRRGMCRATRPPPQNAWAKCCLQVGIQEQCLVISLARNGASAACGTPTLVLLKLHVPAHQKRQDAEGGQLATHQWHCGPSAAHLAPLVSGSCRPPALRSARPARPWVGVGDDVRCGWAAQLHTQTTQCGTMRARQVSTCVRCLLVRRVPAQTTARLLPAALWPYLLLRPYALHYALVVSCHAGGGVEELAPRVHLNAGRGRWFPPSHGPRETAILSAAGGVSDTAEPQGRWHIGCIKHALHVPLSAAAVAASTRPPTSHTASPMNASAVAFQLRRGFLPRRSGGGGSSRPAGDGCPAVAGGLAVCGWGSPARSRAGWLPAASPPLLPLPVAGATSVGLPRRRQPAGVWHSLLAPRTGPLVRTAAAAVPATGVMHAQSS